MDLKTVALSNVNGAAPPLSDSGVRRSNESRRATTDDQPEPLVSKKAPDGRSLASRQEDARGAEDAFGALKDSEVAKEANPVLDEFLKNPRFELSFKINEATNDVVVTVIDPETKDVIRQIPPEEMLRLAERLDATRGSLVSSKV